MDMFRKCMDPVEKVLRVSSLSTVLCPQYLEHFSMTWCTSHCLITCPFHSALLSATCCTFQCLITTTLPHSCCTVQLQREDITCSANQLGCTGCTLHCSCCTAAAALCTAAAVLFASWAACNLGMDAFIVAHVQLLVPYSMSPLGCTWSDRRCWLFMLGCAT